MSKDYQNSQNTYLKGKVTWSLGLYHHPENGHRNYVIRFHRGGRSICEVHYHMYAKQIVLTIKPDISLTELTIRVVLPFLGMDMFRLKRRQGQALIRESIKRQRELS